MPPVEEEADAGSEVSEWELRECQEREDERRVEEEALGAGEEPLFRPTPPFMASVGEEQGSGGVSFCFSFPFVYFLGA